MREILESPKQSLYQLFEQEYIDNILKPENMIFACVDKKTKTVKKYDIKEIGDNDEAIVYFNKNELNRICPSNKYYRISHHTHGILLKDQTDEDYKSMKLLFNNGNADAFCTSGNDGILCKTKKGEIHKTWDNIFKKIIEKAHNSNEYSSSDQINLYDQIYCFLSSNDSGILISKCLGRNNDSDSENMVNMGDFQDVSASNIKLFHSTADGYIQNIITKSESNKKIKCITLEKDSQRYLICNTE